MVMLFSKAARRNVRVPLHHLRCASRVGTPSVETRMRFDSHRAPDGAWGRSRDRFEQVFQAMDVDGDRTVTYNEIRGCQRLHGSLARSQPWHIEGLGTQYSSSGLRRCTEPFAHEVHQK